MPRTKLKKFNTVEPPKRKRNVASYQSTLSSVKQKSYFDRRPLKAIREESLSPPINPEDAPDSEPPSKETSKFIESGFNDIDEFYESSSLDEVDADEREYSSVPKASQTIRSMDQTSRHSFLG